MKIQFKHQKFQAEAAEAVCEIFRGQGRQRVGNFFGGALDDYSVGANAAIELNDERLLKNLRGVQKKFSIPLSRQLEGKNFSVEMETGVGKTYTYIKTMYELNKNFGWSKFMIVVPSVAIREGVKKSFAMTEEHFAEEYGEKIRYFVYNSKNLSVIKSFVSDSKIWAMIVNVQAFSSRSEDARRMLQELDEFNSRVPIEVIAKINPIIIIDEPQSVEGAVAKEKLAQFKPLMTLRYSATHKNLFNQVYRLNALDAYRRRLVKKISVKGIEIHGGNSSGYIFLESINLSGKNPTATLTFKRRGASEIKRVSRKISVGDDLYKLSEELEEYRGKFIVTEIDGEAGALEFMNGLKIFVGQAVGDVDEAEFRRIQIRETIRSHLEREAELFPRGIKVLSLFFIDEVAKYRLYDEQNFPRRGPYAKIFEEEYSAAVKNFDGDDEYKKYLAGIAAADTHAGYFSVDKKNRQVNSKNSEDVDAYDLIMRDKEKLLDMRTPVRFIFSHSALREGWDNPNVFQICTLKQSSSDVRRRQEVGRGMRLCVNRDGERMDEDKLGGEIHAVNVLTVVANESYGTFAAGLQSEIAEAINLPTKVTPNFFVGRKICGREVDEDFSRKIYNQLIKKDYVDDDGRLTEKFFTETERGEISFGEQFDSERESLIQILADVGKVKYEIEDANKINVEAKLDEGKLYGENFQGLWKKIRRRGFYSVEFDSGRLIAAAGAALKKNLSAAENFFVVESGSLNDAATFDREHSRVEKFSGAPQTLTADLIGKLAEATELTRRDIAEVLKNFAPKKIDAENFVANAAKIIKEVKGAQLVDGITYTPLDEAHSIKIFFGTTKGRLNVNAVKTAKNLYDHLISDSKVEKDFAAELEVADEVSVYVKLPNGFKIPTPLGNYNPDWAVVIRDKIYFIVETKGGDDPNQLREVERGKIFCARKFFDATTDGSVKYRVKKNYADLRSELNEL
ncbi:MAG: DEAD/DEAH box helicase family protein [Selenomonadaceae bacterium]|nr:DEAD/DEAH box helicase family protein [Selenomonadaceae bacterium]